MNILVFIIHVVVTVDGREWQIPVYEEYYTDYDSIYENFQDPSSVTPVSTSLNPDYTNEAPLLSENGYNPELIHIADQQNNSQDFNLYPGYIFY